MELKSGRVEGRLYQPETVEPMHEKDRRSYLRQCPSAAFGGSREEQYERERELKYNQSRRDPLPAAADSMQIPRDLFGEIFRPDQQELRKTQISPKHDESEQKIAEIVKTVGRYHLGQRRFVPHQMRSNDRERQGRKAIAHHENHAKNGRVPFRLEGHHPVDGGKRDRQPIQRQTGSAEPL